MKRRPTFHRHLFLDDNDEPLIPDVHFNKSLELMTIDQDQTSDQSSDESDSGDTTGDDDDTDDSSISD
jgi:hypothetical protein